jgi:two-component system cell cycle sensor histidine kinase/response regulator CckA
MRSTPIKLLLIEDNPGDARLIREMLGEALGGSADVTAVESLADARGKFDGTDAVLLDLGLPDSRGLDTLRTARRTAPRAAIVVLTGLDDEDLALHAVREGAQDYVVKGHMRADSLGRAVRYAVERRRVEESLRTSEELNRRIIENMPGGLVQVDADGSIVAANEHAVRFLGLRRDELTHRLVADFAGVTIHEDGRPFLPENYPISRALLTGRPAGPETIGVRRPDGRVHWGVFSATPLHEPGGAVTGGVVTFVDITDRKREEARLHMQRATLERVATGAPLAKVLIELQRLVEDSVPGGICRITLQDEEGVRPGDSAPGLPLELVAPLRRTTPCGDGVTANAGSRFGHATIVSDTAADPRWVELRETARRHGIGACWSHPVHAWQGQVVGTIAILHAVAREPDRLDMEVLETAAHLVGVALARARSEQALEEERTRLELALRGADMGLWDWNIQTGRLVYNDRWARMLGYELEEIEPRVGAWEALIHPDDFVRVTGALAAHLEGRADSYEAEYRLRAKSGLWVWVLDRGRVLERDAKGRPLRAAGTHLDVTERKLAAEAIRESEQRFRAMADSAPVLIWMTDAEGHETYYNTTWLRYTGESFEEALDHGWRRAIHPDDAQRCLDAFTQAQRDRAPFTIEYRLRRADGSYGWLLDQGVPRFSPDGAYQGHIGSCADITRRRKAEARTATQSRVLDLLTRGRELSEVLAALVGSVESVLPDSRAAIVMPEDDGRRVRAVIAPSLPETYARTMSDLVLPQAGSCCAEALEGRQRRWTKELALDAHWRAHAPLAAELGLRACWCEPILSGDGRVLGALAIHFSAPRTPTEEELEFAGFATQLAGIAVERHRAEQALRESETRFKAIVENTPDVAIEGFDRQGRVLFWNNAAERMFGWTEQEALGKTLGDLILDEAGNAEFVASLEQIGCAGHSPEPVEWEYTHRDGHTGTCYSSIFAIPGSKGDRTYICIDVDITQRKRAEESLRQSEATQRALLAAIPDLLFRMRRDGTYLDYIGPRNAKLLAPPSEFLGRKAEEVLPPDHARQLRLAIDRAMATGTVAAYEYSTGTRAAPSHHEVRVVPCGTDEVLAVVRNITARQRAEDALRESEQRYRGLVEASPDGILVHQDGRIVFTNSMFAKMMEARGVDELIGLPVIDLVHPDDRETVVTRIRRIIEEGQPATPRMERLVTRKGQPLTAEIAGSICVHNGRPAVQVVVRDVRERKRLEDDLRQAQKLQAVGQLASGVAHDFNNLLTAIFGYTSLARRTLAPSHPANRSLERVDEAARQASGVTKALLTFSRHAPGEKRPVRLVHVVEEAVRLLRRTLPASVKLETDMATVAEAWVDADPTQLQQVVLNLAINARDAMPDGGRLRIALEPGGSHPGTVRLIVSDTGTGMTPEVESHIFEPFFTTKPPEKGTGLGLPIVHGIVKEHDGTITVRTAPSRGSTFTVELPRVPVPQPSDGPARKMDHPQGRGECILLVEDHTYVRELLASTLAGAGYEVVQAGTGGEIAGILTAVAPRVRLIVLDHGLPDGPGEQWLDRVRTAGHDLPAVVLVGEAGVEVTRPGGPPTIVVRKPFQVSDLVAAVSQGLGRGLRSEGNHEPTDLGAAR